jgi:hypothetical protein
MQETEIQPMMGRCITTRVIGGLQMFKIIKIPTPSKAFFRPLVALIGFG